MMKKPLAIILAVLGIRRQKPKTRMGRILRNGERAVAVLAALYLALLTYPQMLFAGQESRGNFRLHMRHTTVPDPAKAIIERAEALLKVSEFWKPSQRHEVYSCDGFGLYAFLCPFARDAYAATYPHSASILLAKADFDHDLCFRNAPTENTRVLSQVIAHEMTHNLLRGQMGFWRYRLLPTWKNEGYCEVISRGRSDSLRDEIAKIAAPTDRGTKAHLYAKYRLLVAYLIQIKGMTFNDIIALDDSQRDVESEMLNWAMITDKSSNKVPEDTVRKLADPQH
jgi:hypothetical protein